MAEPLSEQVLQWIVDGLGAIRKADGYHTDIGLGTVTTEPTQAPSSNDEAYTLVFDTAITRNSERSGGRTLATDMDVTIEFVVPRGLVTPTKLARRGRDDITRVLHRELREAPAGLRSLVLNGTAKLVLDDERRSKFVIAQVTARAGLSETFSPATNP